MEIKPVATFRSPLPEKFGIPRQAGLAESLEGRIVMEPEFRREEALRGLEEFDYLWLIWGFHLNGDGEGRLTVRPPRLGGNERIGVFASRSPFRPNGLGLSSVRIDRIENNVIHVRGADLADGTPIYDIKPYVEYSDSHPGVRNGFVDSHAWTALEVVFPEGFECPDKDALREILAQDPRPRYHDDPEKVYGFTFAGREIHFTVKNGVLYVAGQ